MDTLKLGTSQAEKFAEAAISLPSNHPQSNRQKPQQLQRVVHIPQKYKDICFGFIRKAQELLPKDSAYFNIVDLIKHWILLYFYHVIESNILTEKEIETFLKLLQDNGKKVGHGWNLIYRASRDGLDRKICINKMYGKPNIMLFIHSDGDCICGGFTATGWNKNGLHGSYSADPEAFMFSLRSPKGWAPFISNVKKEHTEYALYYGSGFYCCFGSGYGTFIVANKSIHAHPPKYYESFPKKYYLVSGNYCVKIIDIEAFELL